MNGKFDLSNLGAQQAGNDRPIFDWRAYWYLARRQKWFLIIPAIIFALAAFYYKLSVIPVYESSTTILVSDSKLMTGSLKRVVPGVTAQDEISVVKNYIMSAKCIAELINTLDLNIKPELNQRAVALAAQLPDMDVREIKSMLFIEQVRENLTVETRGRDVIKIAAEHENPQKAYMLTKTLAQVFIDEFQKRQLGGIRGVREFSEEQLSIYEEKLRAAEKKLREFKEGILHSQMDDLDMGQATLERFKSDITTLEVSIRDKHERVQALQNELTALAITPRTVESPAISTARRELFGKIDQLVNILSKFTWKDPQIIELNDDINRLRERIRTAVAQNVDDIFGERNQAVKNLLVEWNMSSLDVEILDYERSAMSKMLTRLESSMTKGPTYEMVLKNLQQEVEYNRELYLNFLHQSQGTQIEEQIQRRDAQFKLQIIELAKKPLYPRNTGLKHTLILACLPLVGLALGGGMVVGLDFLNHSVKDIQDVETEFDLPVWGVIPEIRDDSGNSVLHTLGTLLLVVLATSVAATLIYIIKKGGLQLPL